MAADKGSAASIAAPAIDGMVALCAAVGGPFTRASINPARSLAPALFQEGMFRSPAISALPLYLTAPFIGAVLASLCSEHLRPHADSGQNVPADLH